MIILTIWEKTLLYLNSNPYASQKTLENTLRSSHHGVAKSLKKLREEGFIREESRYVEDKKRRLKTYTLTGQGRKNAENIEKKIGKETITIIDMDGKEKEIRFSKINEFLKKKVNKTFTITEILSTLEKNRVELRKLIRETTMNIDFASEKPEIKHFYGREKEIKTIDEFIESKTKTLSIRGIAGIGKTVLITKALEKHKHKYNVFYHRLHSFSTTESMLRYLSDFLSEMKKNRLRAYLLSKENIENIDVMILLSEEMRNTSAVLVFDDIHKIKKETCVFLNELLQTIIKKTNNVKLIVSGRQTPEGVYDKKQVLDRNMKEIILTGLDKKPAEQLLNEKGIKTGTEKIYTITKGHPLLLELIKDEENAAEDAYSFLRNEIYNRVNDDEKNILGLCSVFRYPFKQRIFLENSISIDAVDNLVDKSLMQRSGDIYDEHDMIKEFIYKRLNEREKIRYHRTAGDYYEKEPGEQGLFEKLHHYIMADYMEETAKTMLKQGEKLIKTGFGKEAMSILDSLDKKRIPILDWVKILLLKGDIQRLMGKLDNALSMYNEALKISKENTYHQGTVESYLGIGRCYEEKSQWDQALINLNRYLEISKKTGDKKEMADAYHNLGYIHWRKGKLNDAERYFRLSLKHTNEDLLIANAYTGLGFVNMDRGKYDAAIRFYSKSSGVFEKAGNKYGTLRTYNNIAVTYARKKEYNMAVEYHEKQIGLAESLGDFRGMAYGFIGVSGDYAEMDMLEEAMDCCRKGLTLAEQLGEKLLISLAHNQYGLIVGKRKNWKKADEHFTMSINIAREIGSITRLADTYFD
ncbi:MAG: tetratricopeptide repeat protein, partial [Thermoplasmatales archaeon]|nr:tetratricopeptide repeat protein [Thermoplasmatales archaeon]